MNLAETLQPYMAGIMLVRNLSLLFFVVLHVALGFWTWRDAQRRDAMPWFWALVSLIFPVAGWLVYLVVRPPEIRDDVRERELEIRAREAELARENPVCPACFKPVDKDFLICPSCMKKLKKECTNCDKALKLDWSVCPYCKTKQ